MYQLLLENGFLNYCNKILDIGCREGILIQKLKKMGKIVYATDRQRYNHNMDNYLYITTKVDIPQFDFDLITSFFVLQHNPVSFVKDVMLPNIVKRLKVDHRFIFTYPSKNMGSNYIPATEHKEDFSLNRYMSIESVKELVEPVFNSELQLLPGVDDGYYITRVQNDRPEPSEERD